MGETANVEIFDNVAQTSECLLKILNGDAEAAELLAEEVHRNVHSVMENIPEIPTDGFNFANMGIWVDPIGNSNKSLVILLNTFLLFLWNLDATDEYIKGVTITNYPNIPASGLGCVTVLIGAYDIESGKPIIGIINQPFYEQDESGRYIFFYCHDQLLFV